MANEALIRHLRTLLGERKANRLPDTPPRGPLRKKPGFAAASGDGVSGIASPLTEDNHTTREYYTGMGITSSDGIFVLEVEPIKTMVMTDAEGNEVKFNFDDPGATET
jgi:hypothetical protein